SGRFPLVDLIWPQPGFREREPDGMSWRIDPRLRDVTRISGGAITDELGVNAHATLSRPLPVLEHEDAGAFANDDSLTIPAERPARRCGIRGVRQPAHPFPHLEARRGDRRVGTAREHHVCASGPNHFKRFTD